jgi:PST family polysaccharide transporter
VPLFLLTGSVASYTAASSFIVGWLSTPEQAGFFGPAEKVVGAALMALGPLTAVLLPHITHLLRGDQEHAFLLIRSVLAMLLAVSIAAACLNVAYGSQFATLLLGQPYVASGTVLKILGLILPLCAVSQCLGMHLLIPFRHDTAVAVSVILGAVISLGAAILLVPVYGAIGMAVSRVIAEITVTVAVVVSTVRAGLWTKVWYGRTAQSSTSATQPSLNKGI